MGPLGPGRLRGGLFYGFSPFILTSLTNAHLNLGLAVAPPLIVGCLDELLVAQRRRSVTTGVILGLLVVLQFFISTEVLLIVTTVAVITVVLTAVIAAVRYRPTFRQHVGYAVRGLVSGAITAVALLAYPVWFALDGPAHFSGVVWPGLGQQYGGTALSHLVFPESDAAVRAGLGLAANLFDGPTLSFQYLGIGAVVVVVAGLLIWPRDRRLWLFGGVVVVATALSLGVKQGVPLPWQSLAGLPLFENVFPSRFILVTYLAMGILIGLVVDHTYAALRRSTRPAIAHAEQKKAARPRWVAAGAGLAVAAVALVPPAAYLTQTIPIQVQPMVLPTWFRTVAPTIDRHQVILTFPVPFTREIAMTWQAVDGIGYAMVGGAGPGAISSRAGRAESGQMVATTADYSYLGGTYRNGDAAALRGALDVWGVTMVVVPDQPELPAYDQIDSVTYVTALVTAATGRPPIHQADAWVWTGVDHAPPALAPTTEQFAACTNGVDLRGAAAVDHATGCVLATAGR